MILGQLLIGIIIEMFQSYEEMQRDFRGKVSCTRSDEVVTALCDTGEYGNDEAASRHE